MIVSCPTCGARYQYDEGRFGESLSKRLRCSKCEGVFEVTRPDAPAELQATQLMKGASEGAERPAERRTPPPAEEALPELAPLAQTQRYSLAVILGANAGHIYAITRPRVYLGRGAGLEVQLPDSEVSRKHARLDIRGDEGTLTDLGSTNGTFVDGVRIDQCVISSHQEFSLGTTTLMFIVTSAGDGGFV